MNLKDIVARAKLHQLKGRVSDVEHEFPAALMRPRNVLVCLPGGLRELTLVKQFLPTLTEMFTTSKFSLLAMPGMKVHDMYPRKGFQILSPTPDQVSWSGLPKKSYLKSLEEQRFDLVIDLNLDESSFTSRILLNFPEAVRVGRGNHRGEPYYNLEIKTKYLRDERNIYRSMFDVLGVLKHCKN